MLNLSNGNILYQLMMKEFSRMLKMTDSLKDIK
jgi:hypothetical protein